MKNEIQRAVKKFMKCHKVAWAKAATYKHKLALYGDGNAIQFTGAQLVKSIDLYRENYSAGQTLRQSISAILNSVTFECPQ